MFRFSASHHFVLERASLSRLLNYYVEISYTVTSRFPVAAFVLDDTVVCLSIVSWRVFGTTLEGRLLFRRRIRSGFKGIL